MIVNLLIKIRLLVGLRWWNDIDNDGNEKWIFESCDSAKMYNPVDTFFFWFFQIISSILWLIIFFFDLIRLMFIWVKKLICIFYS